MDDEMFLDAEENLSDEVAVNGGFPISQKSPVTPTQQHIIYKRKQDVQEDPYSDYGEYISKYIFHNEVVFKS